MYRETSKSSRSFFKLFHDFQFIFALVVSRYVLERTLPATKLLQKKNADIVDGLALISSLKDIAHSMLVNAKDYHQDWYTTALEIAKKVNVVESKRRTCGQQMHRPNHEHSSTSDYYYKSLTTEFLAHLCNQLDDRFDNTSSLDGTM